MCDFCCVVYKFSFSILSFFFLWLSHETCKSIKQDIAIKFFNRFLNKNIHKTNTLTNTHKSIVNEFSEICFSHRKIILHSMCVCFMYMFAIQLFDCKNIIWNVENYKIDTQRLRVAWCSWKSEIMEWGAKFRIKYQFFVTIKVLSSQTVSVSWGGTWIRSNKQNVTAICWISIKTSFIFFENTTPSSLCSYSKSNKPSLAGWIETTKLEQIQRWMIEIV